MVCINCKSSLQDKKFPHPILQDEWVCINCFEKRVNSNHIEIKSDLPLNLENFTQAGIKDDFKLGFILCTEGSNSNRDGFDEEGLKEDYQTAKLQRLDWEHTDEVIGVISESEFVQSSNFNRIKELGANISKSFIYISGVLWKILNKARAKEVKKRWEHKSLYCSMEDYFDYVICSTCGGKYIYDNEYCEHLSNRFSTAKNTYRILRGSKFVGAGVVQNPADRDAVGLALAKDEKRHRIIAKLLDPDVFDYYKYMRKRYEL